ncbi:MAG: ferredoxin family protein [Bacillota bacterium]
MAQFNSEEDPLRFLQINQDNRSHISIKDEQKCREKCDNKPCTFICPSEVFNWDWEEEEISFKYQRCIECGVCAIACPQANIFLEYPRGGYGVQYKY